MYLDTLTTEQLDALILTVTPLSDTLVIPRMHPNAGRLNII